MNFNPTPRPKLHGTRASELLSKPIKPLEWMVENLIPMKEITLLYGDGGTGKSTLALQLANAAVKIDKWLGLPTKAGATVYLSCEDDGNVIHRRLIDFGSKAIDVDDLVIIDCANRDQTFLVEITPDNKLTPTSLFGVLEDDIKALTPTLVILDNLNDIFPDEGYGKVLPRQFIRKVRNLAIKYNCAVLILAHPSKAGMATGRGDSGSTAWNDTARSRLYFKTDDNDKSRSTLTSMKNNHGPRGQEFNLQFVNNKFEREVEVPKDYLNLMADNKFLELMRWHEERGQPLNPTSGPYYAPKVFGEHPLSEGITKDRFRTAMKRLMYQGVLGSVPHARSNKLVITK